LHFKDDFPKMNPSQRLKPIKKLADNKEKTAAQNLGKSVENRKQQIDKLTQLTNYRTEYMDNMTAQTQQGINGEKLQQYHHFLNKLDTAIEHQNSIVYQSEQHVSQSQQNWKSDNSRASVISKVIKNMKNKEVRAQEKQEANQIDELSTQAFLRRKQF
ncbi:MAG: flagellar export protein FliJ, partial [Kangiellaceae bacterium]|nr:flagellar export protein FliJ [Kangiellaceae bacterium]